MQQFLPTGRVLEKLAGGTEPPAPPSKCEARLEFDTAVVGDAAAETAAGTAGTSAEAGGD
jgi:hypothetical protein